MKNETSEAFARLVSSYVSSIEGAGAVIPSQVVEQLTTDPIKTCEALNELALSCGAIDDALDAALAAIYESMDAADARGPVDELCAERIARAWVRTHVEPEPEPEPEGEDDGVWSTYDDEAPKRKRRSRKEKAAEDEQGEATEDADASDEHGEEAETEQAPAKKRSRKAKKDKAEQDAEASDEQAAAPAETGAEDAAPASEDGADEGDTSDATQAAAESTQSEASAEAAVEVAPASAAGEALSASDETLSVDQAVAILGVSKATIYKLIESGELPAGKKGRSWRISAAAVADKAAGK